jgi:hypothetical protein
MPIRTISAAVVLLAVLCGASGLAAVHDGHDAGPATVMASGDFDAGAQDADSEDSESPSTARDVRAVSTPRFGDLDVSERIRPASPDRPPRTVSLV